MKIFRYGFAIRQEWLVVLCALLQDFLYVHCSDQDPFHYSEERGEDAHEVLQNQVPMSLF